MNASQPFGRRGRPVNSPQLRPNPPTPQALPPELLATILTPAAQLDSAELAQIHKVAWSLRAAVLAGLVAGVLSAAVKATTILNIGGIFEQVPLGGAKLPFAVALAAAGLWGGARSSALALLVVHTFLNRIGQTNYSAYAVAGGAASAAYALLAAWLGFGADHAVIADAMAGTAAGFFYRLFAATERHSEASFSAER
jgi:hypothetical protein